MGQTDRWNLRYPESGDENNVPTDMSELAADVEAALSRAFVCTSSTRPTGVPDGFLIYETDTGLLLVRDDPAWVGTGSGGGGGGGATGSASYSAGTTAQNIANAVNVIVAFGTEVDGDALVTRQASGAGHKFVLGASGIWAAHATIRYASNAAAGVRDVGMWADADINLAHSGGAVAGQPATHSLGTTRYLPSGTEITVVAFQSTGATRALEPNSGAWVHIDIALVG